MNTGVSESERKFLHSEFIDFMKKHSVYETIPENMKVSVIV